MVDWFEEHAEEQRRQAALEDQNELLQKKRRERWALLAEMDYSDGPDEMEDEDDEDEW